jgi:hypothetical protein
VQLTVNIPIFTGGLNSARKRQAYYTRYDYVIDTLSLKQAAGVLTPEDVLALNEWLD